MNSRDRRPDRRPDRRRALRRGLPGGDALAVAERQREIVRAALELLEETGFEALSLRPLARHLGMHAPGLYWYLESKQELIDLMARAIVERELLPVPALAPGQSWQDWLIELACRMRRALLAHRDGARVVAGAYHGRAHALAPIIEQSLTILEQAGFGRLRALGGTMTILRYASAIALDEQSSPVLATAPSQSRGPRGPGSVPIIDAQRWPRTADALRQVVERNLRDPDRMFRAGAAMIVRGLADSLEDYQI